MDRQVLLRKIMGIGDEIRRLEQDIIALQSIDIVNYPDNYSSLSQQAAIRSEYLTRKLIPLYCERAQISAVTRLKFQITSSAPPCIPLRVCRVGASLRCQILSRELTEIRTRSQYKILLSKTSWYIINKGISHYEISPCSP